LGRPLWIFTMRRLRTYIVLISFGSSCLGYLIFRENIILFQWINKQIFQNSKILETKKVLFSKLPEWILYNFSDAIWVMTLIYILLLIWDFRITMRNIWWIISPVLIAYSFEFGQRYNLINGTYDQTDLLFILIGSFIPFVEIIKTKYNEKANQ